MQSCYHARAQNATTQTVKAAVTTRRADLASRETIAHYRRFVVTRHGLTDMPPVCILVHMRTTLILDERLLERASQLTGIRRKTALVRAGLEALIAREAARRLAALAGAEPGLRSVPRRRPWAKR
jgi:hypothetical protein